MVVEKNSVVSIMYSLFDAHQNLIESNAGYYPIVYLHGAGNILAGLEEGLEGLMAGETADIVVSPGNEKTFETQVRLAGAFDEVNAMQGIAMDVHQPQAAESETLHFTVKVISIRKATAIEINNGFPSLDGQPCCPPGCC